MVVVFFLSADDVCDISCVFHGVKMDRPALSVIMLNVAWRAILNIVLLKGFMYCFSLNAMQRYEMAFVVSITCIDTYMLYLLFFFKKVLFCPVTSLP